MALEDLTPAVRVEAILDGADIDPATRLEYFLSKAANEVPKPDGVSDAGKVVTVNSDGDGFILNEVDPGLPDISGVSDAGKVVTVNSAGSAYELSEVDPGLPDISGVSDAGKVVSVNSAGSAYELTTPSSGGVMVITLTSEDNVTFSSDKTFAEIVAAIEAGVPTCIATVTVYGPMYGYLASYTQNSNQVMYFVVMPVLGAGPSVTGVSYYLFVIRNDNSVTLITKELT